MGKDSSMDDKWKALEKYNLWGGNTYQLGLERKAYTDKIGNLWGRYVEFHILPYSYAEYLQLMQQLAGRASYLTYLQKGGLSELYNLPTVESEKQYVASVKDMILLRDISPFVI